MLITPVLILRLMPKRISSCPGLNEETSIKKNGIRVKAAVIIQTINITMRANIPQPPAAVNFIFSAA